MWDPVQATLDATLINGHKTTLLAAYSKAMRVPVGPFVAGFVPIFAGSAGNTWCGEVRILNVS